MSKEELWKAWGYQFEYWIERLQSAPVELAHDENHSDGYNKDEIHVFKLESGQYAIVKEQGCSCYSSSEAEIELFPNKQSVKVGYNAWLEQRKKDGYDRWQNVHRWN